MLFSPFIFCTMCVLEISVLFWFLRLRRGVGRLLLRSGLGF